jgi:hypothetical protein
VPVFVRNWKKSNARNVEVALRAKECWADLGCASLRSLTQQIPCAFLQHAHADLKLVGRNCPTRDPLVKAVSTVTLATREDKQLARSEWA